MPDSPDYSKYLPGSNRFSLQDMGELASRLGSPIVYDRRGDVVFYDTFNNGLSGWLTSLSGTGASVDLSSDHIYRYPYIAKITAGSTASKQAVMGKTLGGWVTGRIGFEIVVGVEDQADFSDFSMDIDDTVNISQVSLRYDHSSFEWSIRDQNGVYQVVHDAGIGITSAFMFIPIKYVVDLDTGFYVRLLIGNTEVDISSYQFEQTPQNEVAALVLEILLKEDAAGNPIMRIAHVIITANEP